MRKLCAFKTIWPSVLILMTLPFFAASANAQETSAALNLQPGTIEVNSGETFNVEVLLDTGGREVNALTADISYPSNLMEFVSVDDSISIFSQIAEFNSETNGVLRISRFNTEEAVSGSGLLVVNLEFKAKDEAGEGLIVFTADAGIADSLTNQDILETTNETAITVLAKENPVVSQVNGPDEGTVKARTSAVWSIIFWSVSIISVLFLVSLKLQNEKAERDALGKRDVMYSSGQ